MFHIPVLANNNIYIIANKTAPVDNITKVELSDMFLGKKLLWSNNQRIDVAYIKNTEENNKNFFKDYINISQKKFQRYWLKKIFSGYGLAPKVFTESALVINHVKNTQGAIAVCYIKPPKDANLKIVTISQ